MKQLLLFVFLIGSLTAFSQGTVTGTITDADLGGPLSNANVLEAGTSNGAIADFDGNFTLTVSSDSGTIEISYVGYTNRTVSFTLTDGTANLGTITIIGDAAALSEVVIVGSGIIDLAEDRKTPVAVSTIRGTEIVLKTAGNREFGEAMKNTPSVYVSNQAGGFGDSQIFLRGFDQTNTAYLLNGQPINGMEDGRMYWSNWSGMSDVANAVQIQRGLGSSKLAISSVGGTVNIVSKATETREGGYARFLTGNDSYFKGTASYSTGLSDKGWAFTFLLDYWTAHRKYSIGTAGEGQTYMFAVGYKPNDKHAFNFLLTGAPQYHDQNFSDKLEDYERYGEKQNSNSGFYEGSRYTERRNYYHKPVMNINWDFNINENMDLATVAYASWGRGGGTGGLGSSSNRIRMGNDIDFDQIELNNIASSDENGNGNFGDSYVRRASVNNHNWYGLLSNLSFDPNENWAFNVGVDGRFYHGDHFRQLNNLFGLNGFVDNFGIPSRPDDYVLTNTFDANPWASLSDFAKEGDGDRYSYDYSEDINYIGGFGQAEFSTESFSAFFQGAFSSQSYQREGRFAGSGGDGLGKSEKVSKTGYNVKGGVNYNVNEENGVFVNAGYYSRQPFLDNIFADIRSSNTLVSPDVDNEEITGFEGGYRFENSNIRLNADVYYTKWGNRFLSYGDRITIDKMDIDVTNRMTDVTQIHKGIEIDGEYHTDDRVLMVRGYASFGNWKYDGETPFTQQNDETNEFIISDGMLDLTGTKVGNAPQTSFGLGTGIRVCDGLSVDADYNIYTDLYGFVDPEDVAVAAENGMRYQAERLPAYTLLDAGLTYKFQLQGSNRLTFRLNVYNVFNSAYINQKNAFGYYLGIGRTWNTSLRYNF